MEIYRRRMKDANRDLAENDSVAVALVEWAERRIKPGGSLEIIAKDLLVQLNEVMRDYPKDLRHWPASPEALAHRLPRLAPVLRAQGIEVRKLKREGNARSRWELRRPGSQVPLFVEDDLKEAA